MIEQLKTFREDVRSLGAHLPQDSLEAAIAFFEDQELVGNRHVARCIQLAGKFAAHAKVIREAAGEGGTSREREVHIARHPLEATPLAEQACMDWVRTLEPWARSVREQLFGHADPPFPPDRWDLAVAWIEKEMLREVEGSTDVAAAIKSAEYIKRKKRARADAAWLAEQSGLPFHLTLAPLPSLAYMRPRHEDQVSPLIIETVRHVTDAVSGMGEDDGITVTTLANRLKLERSTILARVAQAWKAGYLKNVESREKHAHRLRPADPVPADGDGTHAQEAEVATSGMLRRDGPLMALAVATEAIAALSGFELREVTSWVLTGVRPSAVRASVRGSVVLRQRPEPVRSGPEGDAEHSTMQNAVQQEWAFRAQRVTVEFYTPDIRNEDLRELRNELNRAWSELRGATDPQATIRQAKEDARREFRRGVRKIMGVPHPAPAPPPHGRLTEKDIQLLTVVDESGGLPDEPTTATWEEIRRCYEKAGYGSIKADSLRRRWGRLASKPRPLGPVAKGHGNL